MNSSFKTLIFRNFPITVQTLNLKASLLNGQSFCWSQTSAKTATFSGVFQGYHLYLRENDVGLIEYSENPIKETNSSLQTCLHDYFQLDVNMNELIEFWSTKDDYFKKIANSDLKGLRILRQDPWECLISFLCSQNNNISRITQMLQDLRTNYGEFICERDGVKYYSFPTLESLLKVKEEELRALGFGYRAAYIVCSIKQIQEKGGIDWLKGLRKKNFEEIRNELIELKGVGMKVADCIALFSLDCKEAVPVDTHIWQIYRSYKGNNQKHNLKIKKDNYDTVAEFFQNKFEKYAGWAHSFLFTAELPLFKGEAKENKGKKNKKKEKRPNPEGFLEECNVKELISAKKTKKK